MAAEIDRDIDAQLIDQARGIPLVTRLDVVELIAGRHQPRAFFAAVIHTVGQCR